MSELRAGIESLNIPFQEVSAELSRADNLRFRELAALWNEALGQDYDFCTTYVGSVLPDPKSLKDHKEHIDNLRMALHMQDSKSIEIWSGYLLTTLRDYITKVADTAQAKSVDDDHQGLKAEARKAREDHRRALLLQSRLDQAELMQELQASLAYAKELVKEVQSAAESAQTAAGFVSGAKLTDRFKKLSADHFTAAVVFRCLTVAAVALGIVGTFVLGFVPGVSHGGTTTTGDAILRVSLLGAVLGLATYFGRQAAYHRDLGTWARTIKEQLLTFDGYVEPLTDDNLRNQLRAAFASRVFGSSPESKEDAGVSLSSSVVGELLTNIGKNGAK